MKQQDLLTLAALLHDIGKFRMRCPKQSGTHQEHSYKFVNEDFVDFFSPCGDTFKNAIRHHHPDRFPGNGKRPHQLETLIEKQVILADRLSAKERAEEDREGEHYTRSALVSVLSRLEGIDDEYRYPLSELSLNKRETIIPTESPEVNQQAYGGLWDAFKDAFHRATAGAQYSPAAYQTIVALLHKYTARIPSATSTGPSETRTIPDISLYDHLRTAAAIAACIGRELTETEEMNTQFGRSKRAAERNLAYLIKGDISGIQNFLYQIVSDGAARQLRGRSFYLQLLTEAIAHYVLRQLDLPITNLILASGGHFYILAPYTDAKEKLDELRRTISEKLWTLHNGDISCMLAGIAIKARDFASGNFSDKWDAVSGKVNQRKQEKWSELGAQSMFENFFEPHQNTQMDWKFDELGQELRNADYLVAFEIPESDAPDSHARRGEVSSPAPPGRSENWRDALKTFGIDIHVCSDKSEKPSPPPHAQRAIVYRLGDTEFLTDIEIYQWEDLPVSYDFRIFRPVVPYRDDTDAEKFADYDYLADASEGVKWLGALRMDVDNLGTVFTEKLENATISRLATLSESFRLFFEGYVPELCRAYNENREKEILELIYAGGDDLFLVGGWSALPEIAKKIRDEFRAFVTGDHVTLSGGIAIEHRKFPLYQFADRSGEAEKEAKGLDKKKDAFTFLQNPMKWKDFKHVSEWHHKFFEALTKEKPLPRDILTRLSRIYSENELEGHRWAWRSIYYFHRLQQRCKNQTDFINELRKKLNHKDSNQFRKEFIHVITRWTALRLRDS